MALDSIVNPRSQGPSRTLSRGESSNAFSKGHSPFGKLAFLVPVAFGQVARMQRMTIIFVRHRQAFSILDQRHMIATTHGSIAFLLSCQYILGHVNISENSNTTTGKFVASHPEHIPLPINPRHSRIPRLVQ